MCRESGSMIENWLNQTLNSNPTLHISLSHIYIFWMLNRFLRQEQYGYVQVWLRVRLLLWNHARLYEVLPLEERTLQGESVISIFHIFFQFTIELEEQKAYYEWHIRDNNYTNGLLNFSIGFCIRNIILFLFLMEVLLKSNGCFGMSLKILLSIEFTRETDKKKCLNKRP